MRTKNFTFTIRQRDFLVSAAPEGECRFMVRMSALDTTGKPIPVRSNIRIGYLTGRARNWLGEFFGDRPSVPAPSAKDACRQLAAWASEQPCFRRPA